ncbi:MAG: phosphopantetheine adenylyltransferase [Euryarchaeota archaeon]|nr:phosphopantetheine adenylyltransferase [Euryarchaeota archaeon]
MARIAVGGTFECLHDGHRSLIRKAFELANGDLVDIGLTSSEMAGRRGRDMPSYATRKNMLMSFIDGLDIGQKQYRIQQLDDPYGSTLTEDYGYIVVSPETHPVALRINELRQGAGLDPIGIVRVNFVMAEDDSPISSTRIVQGEIDIHGHLMDAEQDEQ